MQRTLYRVRLSIADIIFRSQFTLPPKLTPLQRTYPITGRKTFLVRNLYTYYFKQSFIVSLKFSSIIVILFTFSGSQREIFAGISSLHSPPWLTRFTFENMSKAQRNRDRRDALLHMANYFFFYSENQYKPQQQYSLPLRWLTFPRIANTCQPHQIL